jgi:integrase
VCKHAGVPTHLHALRHFAATHLLASSVDARSVAERLGHADPSMTLGTYAAALPATDERSAELLGALLVGDG